MSAAVSTSETRLLLGMTPPPPDREERERERERERAGRLRTLLDLLTTEKFDGSDSSTRAPEPSSASGGGGEDGDAVGGGGGSKWRILRFGCCGTATWRYGSPPEEEENGGVAVELQEERETEAAAEMEVEREMERETGGRRSGGMNLAAALAAERQYRAAENAVATPTRVSLMRLLEETTTVEEREKGGGGSGGGGGGGAEEVVVVEEGNDSVCCVCMGRKKGAALIPCGHTYCRVCSREVWVNRGACPLCNRPILEILDIF